MEKITQIPKSQVASKLWVKRAKRILFWLPYCYIGMVIQNNCLMQREFNHVHIVDLPGNVNLDESFI
jgi:hypothetical protein